MFYFVHVHERDARASKDLLLIRLIRNIVVQEIKEMMIIKYWKLI